MIKLIWICQNDLRPLPKKVMEKKNIKGRITFVEVSTEELVTSCLARCGPKSLLDDTYIEYYAKNAYYYFLQVHPPSRHC